MTTEIENPLKILESLCIGQEQTHHDRTGIEAFAKIKSELSGCYKKISALKDEIYDMQEQIDELELEGTKESRALEEEISVLADKVPPVNTLYDEQKEGVINRLRHNLSLEQLENVERTAKTSFANTKQNYVEHF